MARQVAVPSPQVPGADVPASHAPQHPRLGIRHDPSQICEHCHRPSHQIHGRTDVLPALRLEPYSAFLAAYRLSRLSCPDALEKTTALDPDDPFLTPPGPSERPTIPPHLLPELLSSERRARRLALLLDSDDPEVRDWAQAEYLKLGRNERRLVREGVFEVKVALDGVDEHVPEDWSANEREEDLEKLKERLERDKERREEREEVEREMVWAREMFGKWFIDGRVDGVFRLAADVLDELLKEVARDEGEEWVTGEAMGEASEEQSPAFSSQAVPKSRGPSSTLVSKTQGAEQVTPILASSPASVASSKRGDKQRPEPVQNAEREPEPEPEATPPPATADPEAKAGIPEQSPLPVPVPLPVLHPSIFSEEGLLNYAIEAIHPVPPPEPSAPVEQQPIRPESQLSSSNQTITPHGHSPNPAVQHDTYADFYSKDPRRRRTPLLHVKPLPNNQPLPKPEREYDSYADFYANDSPPADPPRLAESKHRRRSDSRHRRRHKSPVSSFEDFAVSSQLSGASGRLTTPAASVGRSRSDHALARTIAASTASHSQITPAVTGVNLTHAFPWVQATPGLALSTATRNTPATCTRAKGSNPVLAPKRSWVPFRIKGGASSNGSPERVASPEPIPVMPRGSRALTSTMASSNAGEREDGGDGAQAEAVVPPAPPLPPVQFWLPAFGGRPTTGAASRSPVIVVCLVDFAHDPATPPPVFLALGARRACVPYTSAFQGIDIRVVRPLSAREKLAMRDAVCVLVRLGAKVVGAEAGGLGVRGEMWSLSYVGF
ncbi:hypothetical protein BJV77DRAFT_1066374 [Russula vinacea]|nr:hypothetical protein BJV77DRAFT_1066374 [Russula vinacea]